MPDALQLGTNCGFVSAFGNWDITGDNNSIYNRSYAMKHTTPAGVTVVTEIGWYSVAASGDVNFEVSIYDVAGDGGPGNLIAAATIQAKGVDAGWKRVTGLNISVDPSTNYWIGVAVGVSVGVLTFTNNFVGMGVERKLTSPSLPNPWDGTLLGATYLCAFYAVVEAGAATGTNFQLNIGGAWKESPAWQINIGGSWKTVAGAKINIGGAWKTIF